MKKTIINNYYTDEDLINFDKLNNFKEFKANKLDNNQTTKHPIKYSISDNSNFKKIMNTESHEDSLSKEVHKLKENTYYNSSDFQKFNRLEQFANFNIDIDKDSETTNEYSKTAMAYTSDDVNKFDKIIKTKNQNTNDPEINSKKIKIIDFNKLNERKKTFKNKAGIEQIKIVYFD